MLAYCWLVLANNYHCNAGTVKRVKMQTVGKGRNVIAIPVGNNIAEFPKRTSGENKY